MEASMISMLYNQVRHINKVSGGIVLHFFSSTFKKKISALSFFFMSRVSLYLIFYCTFFYIFHLLLYFQISGNQCALLHWQCYVTNFLNNWDIDRIMTMRIQKIYLNIFLLYFWLPLSCGKTLCCFGGHHLIHLL